MSYYFTVNLLLLQQKYKVVTSRVANLFLALVCSKYWFEYVYKGYIMEHIL